MKKDFAFYRKLFTSTFYLSAFTFGGGYVIIPLMRKKFVEQFHWIEETEMLDLTAIAQSAPGPIAVNASILIGYRLAGFAGAMVSTLGTVLPPLIILSLISLAYTAFQSSLIVKLVLRGMQAGKAVLSGQMPGAGSRSAAAGAGSSTLLDAKPAAAKKTAGYAPGDLVEHKVFGRGKVLKVTPMAGDSLVEVQFDRVGVKKTLANYAPMTKCTAE